MDQPTISDSEYDHLFHQVKALEEQYPELVQADSPTTKVGGQALSKIESVTHGAEYFHLVMYLTKKTYLHLHAV